MSLSRLTKITGPGIATDTNLVGNNANLTGITTTGTSFNVGITTIHSTLIESHNIKSTGIITATGAHFSGNVSIGGTLTYEDVTNIDSVGIVTALGFKTRGTSSDAGATNGFTAGRINIYDNNSHNIFRIGTHPSYAPTVFSTSNITFSTNGFYVRNTAATRDYIGINNSTGILQLGYGASSGYGYKLETSAKGIKVGTGVTIETNGQAEVAGITTFYKDVHIKSATNRLYVGANDRISLIADPSHSYLRINGGHFQIHNNNFGIRSYDGNGSITLFYSPINDGSGNGGPRLYHYNGGGSAYTYERLRTTTSGVNIVGTTTSTQLAVTGVSTFTGNIVPSSDSATDIGTNSVRFANIYADTLYGDGSNLTGISGVTINNNADNRVITGSGTANTLNGESKVNIDSSGRLIIGTNIAVGSNDHYDDITINNSNSTGNAGSAGITLVSNNGQYGGLIFEDPDVDQAGYIKYYHNSNLDQLVFGVNNGARWEMISAGHWVPHTDSSYDVGTNTKRVRNVYTDSFYATSLSYNGNQLKLGDGNGPTSSAGYYDDIKIDNSNNSSGEAGGTGIEFISGNQSWAGLIFSDSDAAQVGYVKYSHQNDYTTIAAAGQERLRLLANNIQAINCTGALTLPLGTTAQRPTAASGMIRYNSTESELEMYNGTEWLAIKTVPNTINLYYLVIGGGGAGGGSYRAGGGGAGAYRTNWNNEAQGGGQSAGSPFTVDVASTPTYSVIIGSGGSPVAGNNGGAGGTTTFATIVANGGTGGAKYEQAAPSNSGTGSGGGGGGKSGTLRAGASGGTYGYAGGAGSDSGSYQCGGGGGGAAGAGIQGNNSASRSNAGDGGSALASTITGSSVLRAGGGGAGAYGGGNSTGGGVNNGPAGGGGGAGRGAYGYRTGESATANTGSGGGGSPGSQNEIGGSGGSGLIILRYSNAATATYTSGVTYTRATIGSDVVDTITMTLNSSQSVTFS